MYKRVKGIDDYTDIHLTPLHEKFLIGIIKDQIPSIPIPRGNTTCFDSRPVYLYKGRRVFSMIDDYKKQKLSFYYIPDDELYMVEKTQRR